MTDEFSEIAYELRWELDHFETYHLDWSFDLEIEPFRGAERADFFDTARLKTPNSIIFKGYLDAVKQIDYPYTNNRWPVMSRRMLDALLKTGNFPHRLIPVAVVDWRVPEAERYDRFGRLRGDITLNNFVAVQMTELLDILDRDRSSFIIDEDNPEYFIEIEKYVFQVPEKGLPTLFRLKGYPVPLFISTQARAALKKAGITGPRYLSLEGYENQADEVDIPVQITGL
jgi:hypothetical protein